MSERKAGYYMIRYAHEQASWEPAEWDGERWVLLGNGGSFSPATIGEVGPRIPTPAEPWQCVTVEPTPLMASAAKSHIEAGHDAATIWRAMLMYAGKPENSQ